MIGKTRLKSTLSEASIPGRYRTIFMDTRSSSSNAWGGGAVQKEESQLFDNQGFELDKRTGKRKPYTKMKYKYSNEFVFTIIIIK